MDELTIIVKTFERTASLMRLLNSFSKLNLDCPILICDDSKKNCKKILDRRFPNLNLTYIHAEFDIGLSAGRNLLLAQVKTPYFVLCDDDFVFDERTDLIRALSLIKAHALDILGGDFYNYVTVSNFKRLIKLIFWETNKFIRLVQNKFETSRYIGQFKENGTELNFCISHKVPNENPWICDAVNNFFIANTKSVRSMGGWDPELKMGEHEDFFYRCKQHHLKVAYLNAFGVRHYPIISSSYKKYRFRSFEFKTQFVKKHGFSLYKEIQVDNGLVLFEIQLNA